MQGAEADDEGGVAGVVEGVERKDVDWRKKVDALKVRRDQLYTR